MKRLIAQNSAVKSYNWLDVHKHAVLNGCMSVNISPTSPQMMDSSHFVSQLHSQPQCGSSTALLCDLPATWDTADFTNSSNGEDNRQLQHLGDLC